MPNHVTNVISFPNDEKKVDEIRSFMTDEASGLEFDFNKLIPMPEYIFRGNLGAEERYKYGKDNWYDWSIENWGTKWNAYTIRWFSSCVWFETAWTSVPKIVKALSEKFPDVEMNYSWADEACGYNVGSIRGIRNGDFDNADTFIPDEGSKEAFELFLNIWGAVPEEFGLRYNENTGTYEYYYE